MSKKFLSCLMFALLMSLPVANAGAAIITFDSKTEFLDRTKASSATGKYTKTGYLGSKKTIGDVTITNKSGAEDGLKSMWLSDRKLSLPGIELYINGWESIDVEMDSSPVYSFGFDIWDAPQADSTFSINLYNGLTNVGAFDINPPDDTPSFSFIGVWSDALFDRVEIREIIGGNQDDDPFGEFYTGTVSAEGAVPLPSSILLLGFGLLALCGKNRKESVS